MAPPMWLPETPTESRSRMLTWLPVSARSPSAVKRVMRLKKDVEGEGEFGWVEEDIYGRKRGEERVVGCLEGKGAGSRGVLCAGEVGPGWMRR